MDADYYQCVVGLLVLLPVLLARGADLRTAVLVDPPVLIVDLINP